MMAPRGSTLNVFASIVGAILLSTAFMADAQVPVASTINIDFVAAAGPVPIGGYLQFTTLLSNNRSTPANVTLSITCSDAYIIVPGATIASPGCTTPVSTPPYPLGTPVGGPYPGCDPNPLGRGLLPTTTTPSPSGPTYPSAVSADGHSAVWRNVTLSTIPVSLPLIGLVNYYQPILCLATVTPGSSAYFIDNPVISVSYVSKNYVKEGLVYTNIIPPPPAPPSPPGTIVVQPGPGGSAPVGVPGPPGAPGPPGVPGSYTNVPTSRTTLIVIIVFVPIPVNSPRPCAPGIVSDTRITNTSTLVGNTTRCNTTEVRTVTNTTTCVPGGADVLVNTTTTTNTLCLDIIIVDPGFPRFPNATNATVPINGTLPPNNGTLPPNNGTLPPINGTLAPNNTLPPVNVTLAPVNITAAPNISTIPPIIIPGNNGTLIPVPTPSNTTVTPQVTTSPLPTTGVPTPTATLPGVTTAPPVATTPPPVATTPPPLATTPPPVATTPPPVATTAAPVSTQPVLTQAPPVPTQPVSTQAPPVPTQPVFTPPVQTQAAPVQTPAGGTTTTAPLPTPL